MNILYCSVACSQNVLEYLSAKTGKVLAGVTVQKFHRLILSGMNVNGASVDALSSIPVVEKIDGKRVTKLGDDVQGNIRYKYLPAYNLPLCRQMMMFIHTFYHVFKWHKKHKKASHVVVCDVLNVSMCLAVLCARVFTRVKAVGIVTDVPGLLMAAPKNVLDKLSDSVSHLFLTKFDGYVFLTEAMNDVLNPKKKPFIVMEGLVDVQMKGQMRESIHDKADRAIIYAGGCYEQYGVKMLIEAFRRLPQKNIRLHIYGRGDMVGDMSEYEQQDSRFKYMGVRPNREIVEKELKATLLVNPRPTHEEFTKYSFPSKNMEYMVSGTPVLTTNLPGMPKEYYPYVFICEKETVQGFYEKLNEILGMPEADLAKKGADAKAFVLEKKNNVVQAARILRLAEDLRSK